MRCVVVGAAGGIGQPLSLLLKQGLPAGSTLALYDVVPVINGVGVDLSHCPTNVKLEAFQGDMKNAANPEIKKALTGANVVVIPAGVPRKPGMTRDDLFNINAGIIKGIIEQVAEVCPKAMVCIITNPVNSTVPIAAEVLKKKGVYDKRRLFGVSTLDIIRCKQFIGEMKNVDPTSVQVQVVGGHSATTMLAVLSQVPNLTFSEDEAKALVKRTANAGTAVVEAKAGAGSATLSMAYAGAHFTLQLVKALQGAAGIVECAYVEVEGQETRFFALPVELGATGVAKVHPVPALSDFETQTLRELIPTLQGNIKKGEDFIRNSPM